MSAVVTMLEWPSICWMTFRSVREASARVAAPCRRSCSRIGGRPSSLAELAEPVGKVLGADGAPVGVGEHRPAPPPAWPGAGAGVGIALAGELVPEQLNGLPDSLAGQPPGACLVQGDGPAADTALRGPAVQLSR